MLFNDNAFDLGMVQEKHKKIGKSLIEDGSVKTFTGLFKYLPKRVIAEMMGIHWTTLENRKSDLGTITLANLVMLADNLNVDPYQIIQLASSEYIKDVRKSSKPTRH